MRDAAKRERRPAAGVDEGRHVPGAEHLLVEDRDIFIKRQQVDLLLISHPDQVMVSLPGEGKNWSAVHLRVVQTVEEMNRAGA